MFCLRVLLVCVLLILLVPNVQAQSHHEAFQSLKNEVLSSAYSIQKEGTRKVEELLRHAACLHVDSLERYAIHLLNDAAIPPSDSLRSILHSFLSEAAVIRCNYPLADSLATLALEEAKPGTREQALAFRNLARLHFRLPDAPKAIEYVERSSALYDSLDLPAEMLRTRLLLQPTLREDGATLAADELLEGIERSEALDDEVLKNQFLLHLAYLHTRMDNPEEGRRIVEELKGFFVGKGMNYYALQLRFLEAWIAGKLRDRATANREMHRVARDFWKLGDHYHRILAHIYLSLSDFSHVEDHDRGFGEVKRAQVLADSLGIEAPRMPLFHSWHLLGRGRLEEAIAVTRETYHKAPLWGRRLHAFQAAENLIYIYLSQNNTDSAYAFFNRYRDARIDWHSTDKALISGRLEAKMAADKLLKEQEKVAQQQAELKDAEIRQQQTVRNVLIGCAAVLVLFLLLAVRAYRQQKRSRKIIEEQKAGLERMDRLNREVFSVIAHDFKSPLITMRILADNLAKADLSKEDLAQYCGDLNQQAGQTQMLLENLLNWARAELKVQIAKKPECQPHAICQEISQSLATVAGGKEIEVINQIPEEVLTPLHADVLRIVLRNLISNAIKFSNRMQRVIVGFDPVKRALFVSDQGVGLDANTQSQLFGQTVVSRLGTAFESGFGLGLYICHELLNKSNWVIQVESGAEAGTRFTFQPQEV